ncbi:DUF5329 family protein [Leptospira sp. 96542]|nr:DUF5329 family protein [Leptospira sp. 96542]
MKSIINPLAIILTLNWVLYAQPKNCEPHSENKKIEILLQKIGKLEGTVVRNGSEHTAQDAEKHLRFKLEEAKKSIFAPKESDWTAQLFIDRIATKSFLTGNEYTIKLKNGKTEKSGVWLKEELKKIETCGL